MTNTSTQALSVSRPKINEDMMRGAMRIALTIEELTADGFVVIGIEYSSGAKPTIQVQTCGLCLGLIERGEATYYRFGTGEIGRYRRGQFSRNECRVVWTERGH